MPPDTQRILSRCEALARHSESREALTRVFLSPEQAAASAEVAGWMREAGMTARIDAIGNVVGRYEGREPGAPCLLLGSHLDTVRDAGRYDGILGVAIAVDCVADLAARGVRLPFAIEVVGFADEEGVRFAATLLGSRALAGTFDANVLDNVDDDGVSMRAALVAAGLEPDRIADAARARGEVLAFVELHIEQGPVLERQRQTIGAVTGVQGISWQEVTISGQSNHAGTTPTSMRHDAGFAAFAIGAFVRGLAIEIGPPQVGTVGKIDLEPNLVNVVARTARLTVDLRNTDETELQSAESKLVACLDELAEREGVTIERRTLARFEPVAFDDRMIDLVEATAERLGLKVRRLPSGAGHDAQMMARICPTAMVFVPSVGGISHNPAEYTSPGDLTAGAQVLLEVMCRLASRSTDPDQLYEM